MTELGIKLAEAIVERGVSKREAARLIGVSHVSINKATEGRPFDFYFAYRVCKWLDVPYSATIGSVSKTNYATGAIIGVLEKYPDVAELFKGIEEEAKAGVQIPEDFVFWLDFALMKIQRSNE